MQFAVIRVTLALKLMGGTSQLVGPLAPSGQNPFRQTSHAVAPSSAWKEPSAQLMHTSCCGWALYVPGAHRVASAEPTEQNVPGGQMTHCSTLDMTASETFLCVPPGQGRAAAAPATQ